MKFSYAFPPMDERELDNGLKLICIPEHEQNGYVLALQVPVGRFSDPEGLEGLCEVTAGLLSKGTESFPAEEFPSVWRTRARPCFPTSAKSIACSVCACLQLRRATSFRCSSK